MGIDVVHGLKVHCILPYNSADVNLSSFSHITACNAELFLLGNLACIEIGILQRYFVLAEFFHNMVHE